MTDADTADDRAAAPTATDAIEVNEPDLIEQNVPAASDAGETDPPRRLGLDDPEVPEADALEQSIPVGRDGDDY